MVILFGFVMLLLAVPLMLLLLFAGLVGRAFSRRSVRLIVAVAIAAALLGLVSGHHLALVALAAVVFIPRRGRRPRRVLQAPTNPWLAQAPFLPPNLVPSALETAWSRAATAARGDPRIAPARARCAELLARAAAEPGDAALAEWAEVVRRRVPELVDAASAAAADAPAPERAVLAGELVDALDRVGAEAEARLATRRLAARDRFDTLRGYVRSRTAPDRDWL